MTHLTWDIDPEIFQLGDFGPRYYGLMFALAFLVSYQIMVGIYRREGRAEEDLSSLLFHFMLGTIIGARVGHCLFYEPAYYLKHPLEILFIWKGGLASHGGTIGVLIAVWLFCRKHPDQPLGWIADRVAAPIGFGTACIRIGNFFNSEIIGKPTELPWGIIFKRAQGLSQIPRHPAMLYEALSYLLMFAFLTWRYRKAGDRLQPGSQIGILFIWIFGSRFFIEFFKENQVGFEEGMALNMGQLLSIPFVLLGIFLTTGWYRKFFPSGYGDLLEETPEGTRIRQPKPAAAPTGKKETDKKGGKTPAKSGAKKSKKRKK